jgi:restriction system protein
MRSEKEESLAALADKRKWATPPPGYFNLAHYRDGIFECGFVSPYTKTAGNFDSEIFVVLQDWASDDGLRGEVNQDAIKYGYTRSLRTNQILEHRLKEHFGKSIRDVYATNLFPFIKPGRMDAKIPWSLLVDAADKFALPQIEIVKPRLVIVLGLRCFQALRQVATGSAGEGRLAAAIEHPFDLDCGAHICCQVHTGRAVGPGRGAAQTHSDWGTMAEWFKRAGGTFSPASHN